jgi:Cu+-exporting ATPase
MGFEARVRGRHIKLGSKNWVESKLHIQEQQKIGNDSRSYLSIDGVLKGSYRIETGYRSDLKQMFGKLGRRFKIALLSGDKDSERDYLRNLMTEDADLQFNFLPHQKLDYINSLKGNKHQVMMIGDGLNDAEALNAGTLGVAVTDDTANFTPGSDAILLSDKLSYLPNFFRFADKSKKTVYISYAISLLYNIIGLFFAVQGLLTPLIAAILMPVSSISVVFFTVTKTKFDAFICKLK